MNKLIFTLAALTLVSPALAQESTSQEAQRNACAPASQQTGEADACAESGQAPFYDETRGDFGDDERPLSLGESDWNGEDD